MNQFSISDIETLSGIKAHTLRIWEQRYNLMSPTRKKSRHRIYNNEDLKYILRISYLYHKGLKISKIAALSEEEIRSRSLDMDQHELDYAIYINQLTESSIDLNQERFEEVFILMVGQLGYEASVTNVLFPLLNKIGLLWMVNSVTPAQEHFASAIIINKMVAALNSLPPIPYTGGRRVLVFTPEGELHEIPMLFIQYQLKKRQVPVISLGKNTPVAALREVIDANPCSHIYFHLVTNLMNHPLDQYLQTLVTIFPAQEIYFSGMNLPSIQLPSQVRYLRNRQSVHDFLQSF